MPDRDCRALSVLTNDNAAGLGIGEDWYAVRYHDNASPLRPNCGHEDQVLDQGQVRPPRAPEPRFYFRLRVCIRSKFEDSKDISMCVGKDLHGLLVQLGEMRFQFVLASMCPTTVAMVVVRPHGVDQSEEVR